MRLWAVVQARDASIFFADAKPVGHVFAAFPSKEEAERWKDDCVGAPLMKVKELRPPRQDDMIDTEFPTMTDGELRMMVTDYKTMLNSYGRVTRDVQDRLDELEAELVRRRGRTVRVPHWVLELLSAHARKRHENISPKHRSSRYDRALEIAREILGRAILPRDINEYHGSDPKPWRKS